MVPVAVLGDYGNAIVQGVEFGFFALSSCDGVLSVFADRETNALAVLAPFEIVRAFGMAFGLAIHDDNIWFDPSVGGLSDWAIAQSIVGLHPFREIDGVAAGSHHEALLILAASHVFEIRNFVVGVVAVLVRDFVTGGTVA